MRFLMGKFHQFLTELSACHTIMARYYLFTFLFLMAILLYTLYMYSTSEHVTSVVDHA